MTKAQFIDRYVAASDISREEFDEWFVALPCACGDETCEGWAAVSNDPFHIKMHAQMYMPAEEK